MFALDRQPVLEGEGLRLRPLRSGDWEALYAVARDRFIWEQHPAHVRWREPVFRTFFADALASKGALVVLDQSDGAMIGSSRFDGLDHADGGSIEIGWTFLARSHWGGATNFELKRLMVSHALDAVARCRFVMGKDNYRSRRALEKIAARLSDKIETRPMAGRDVAHVVYTIDRTEFAAGPLGARRTYPRQGG